MNTKNRERILLCAGLMTLALEVKCWGGAGHGINLAELGFARLTTAAPPPFY